MVGAASGGAPGTQVALPMADPAPASGTAYPGTVATSVSIEGDSRVVSGGRQELVIEVRTAGDARPQGDVTIVYNREGGEYREQRTVAYTGQPLVVKSSSLGKPGRYVVTVSFRAAEESIWQDSAGEFAFQVVGKGS